MLPLHAALLSLLAASFFLGDSEAVFVGWTEDRRPRVRHQALAFAILTAAEPRELADMFLRNGDAMTVAYAREALGVRMALDAGRRRGVAPGPQGVPR